MIMVAWVYGCNRFLANIEEMFYMPGPLKLYWRAMWTLVSPLVLVVVIILKWVEYKDMDFETSTGDLYVYPAAVQALGWFFELSPTILTLLYPGWVLHRFACYKHCQDGWMILFSLDTGRRATQTSLSS